MTPPQAPVPKGPALGSVPYAWGRLVAELVIAVVLIVGGGWLLVQPHSTNVETGYFAVISGIVGYFFGRATTETR